MMYCAYKNRNDNNEVYVGGVLTSPENAKIYIDVDTFEGGHIRTMKPDWKNSHINSVSVEDVLLIAPSIEILKRALPEYLVMD